MSGIEQTPQELLDYIINWPNRGLPSGATIASSVFTQSSGAFTLSSEAVIAGATQTQFWLTGGVAGTIYQITNEITLTSGQVMYYTVNYYCLAKRTL